ncbi:MAG TPA: hypothetical protein VMB50_24980 [Myxococcales bacterium]|nr:hypothetical protein [Myxococcales bacterium]
MDGKEGRSHRARKRLFAQGLRRRWVTVEEIEEALPAGSLTAAERWLLYYSLRAAGVEIRGELPLPGGTLPIVERDSH